MKIKEAEFVTSNTDVEKCPEPKIPEYAFIGRSNVGKSSLINAFTGKTKLAKTSSTPGKTQLINHFIINNEWYLCDLPGYGYAQVSKTEREKFMRMVKKYLASRENLMCTFVLVDIRHEPLKNDLDFMAWMGEKELPFAIIFTKADKLGQGKISKAVATYKRELKKQWEEFPPMFITSSEDKTGVNDLRSYIGEINEYWES
ncbi:ribosome biogenesis GTP-binding protein YihA/YsxC [Flammeovirga sp. EKP202]|uniref:ribosome biogenesis GTP-binding protein YihA/YsxC n=1 Tax=Flammeovirga sp. EKP202 TaxID=2770592 RepID=UPI00165F0930|nr:ribosome biogenesis GTP-binding protein YihA/YsxC [Flammeovirga sp. EKP202]MBD0402552.1 YihA family ribosome biogenesis GTP-binding protein [Flammeovirga sp. EKP202]